MKCAYPLHKDTQWGPMWIRCKKCVSCRILQQRSWTMRLLLEMSQHSTGSFTTLTYESETKRDEKLQYEDVQRYLKRLRKLTNIRIRFFCSGEYGPISGHAHWHLIIFGISPDTDLLTSCWPHGFSYHGTVEPASAAYTARYCLKLYESKGQAVTNSSRMPGIGSAGLANVGLQLAKAAPELISIPPALRMGGRSFPMDAYCREQLFSPDPRNSDGLPTGSYIRNGGHVKRRSGDLTAAASRAFELKMYGTAFRYTEAELAAIRRLPRGKATI